MTPQWQLPSPQALITTIQHFPISGFSPISLLWVQKWLETRFTSMQYWRIHNLKDTLTYKLEHILIIDRTQYEEIFSQLSKMIIHSYTIVFGLANTIFNIKILPNQNNKFLLFTLKSKIKIKKFVTIHLEILSNQNNIFLFFDLKRKMKIKNLTLL